MHLKYFSKVCVQLPVMCYLPSAEINMILMVIVHVHNVIWHVIIVSLYLMQNHAKKKEYSQQSACFVFTFTCILCLHLYAYVLCLVVEEIATSMHCQVPRGRCVVWRSLCCNWESDSITACDWFTDSDWNLLRVTQYCWGSLFPSFSGLCVSLFDLSFYI